MNPMKLDERLLAVASFVRKGKTVVDVGTDHAYVPVYLVSNGITPSAIACDVKPGPLDNARETISAFGLNDKISTFLSDGLDSVAACKDCDIIFAGMGGMLIEQLLARADWLKSRDIRIIAQPMSHPENVRRFFAENGFEIVRETAVADSRHSYCVMAAEYTGAIARVTDGYIYYGRLFENPDDAAVRYLKKQYDRLTNRLRGIHGSDGFDEEAKILKSIIDEFDIQWRNLNADCKGDF